MLHKYTREAADTVTLHVQRGPSTPRLLCGLGLHVKGTEQNIGRSGCFLMGLLASSIQTHGPWRQNHTAEVLKDTMTMAFFVISGHLAGLIGARMGDQQFAACPKHGRLCAALHVGVVFFLNGTGRLAAVTKSEVTCNFVLAKLRFIYVCVCCLLYTSPSPRDFG